MPKPEEKILISFRAKKSLHRAIRMLAAKSDRTIESVASDALEYWIGHCAAGDAYADLSARREARS